MHLVNCFYRFIVKSAPLFGSRTKQWLTIQSEIQQKQRTAALYSMQKINWIHRKHLKSEKGLHFFLPEQSRVILPKNAPSLL